ncbi:MAG TPA: YebC/PmpR family DNA-binding transcriptional regulator [Bacilli bacterium]|nr:YebC/PmpR family DNA-binding transcriptional regulator [Bacilli bacterium]
MAGHSKWNNIKRRKNAQDAKRGKVFMKAAKDIYVAAKEGGADPETNAALRLAIDKAKAENMPNENIERNIKKATGTLDGVSYEEITYEGYGPGGTAVMVELLTDNKNRSAAEVRHAFSKSGGNLGENGCVAFMFNRKGYIVIDRSTTDADEDTVMLAAIEAGADEMETSDEVFEIYTETESFKDVRDALVAEGFELDTAEVTFVPTTYTELDEDNQAKMERLIERLEDLDDVQDVHHNAE